MVCVRTLELALLHDATFLYVEAEAAVAHAPMNSVSDVRVATAYLLILSTAHMQASESFDYEEPEGKSACLATGLQLYMGVAS